MFVCSIVVNGVFVLLRQLGKAYYKGTDGQRQASLFKKK